MFYNGLHDHILEGAKDGNGSDYCDAIKELSKDSKPLVSETCCIYCTYVMTWHTFTFYNPIFRESKYS